MQLTPHFNLNEFTKSRTATVNNIDNQPTSEATSNLAFLAQKLEKVRALLGNRAMSISSGYRSPELNRAVKGSAKSHHTLGWAADFTCWSFGDPIDIVRALVKSDIEFDQIIEEGDWVHISFKPSYRNQALVAKFDSKGKASYKALA